MPRYGGRKMKKSLKTFAVLAAALLASGGAFAKSKAGENKVKMEKLKLETKWDKTFALSEKVTHKKVTFTNHFGITLAADMYTPKTIPENGKFAAIAISGPFGAVKEQASGFYANKMAERGFLTIAFDPSFTGESGGQPRYMNSPDINTEDFQAAVDFLSVQENVDPEKIGIIGICGWGGMALNAAGVDTRIKATAVMTMYDLVRVTNNGYFDAADNPESRQAARVAMNKLRTECFAKGEYPTMGGLPEERPENPEFQVQYWDYYKTKRGYHPRSLNSNGGWAATASSSLMNTKLFAFAGEIQNAVLIVHGEKAHSRYMGETAYSLLKGDNKELMIIPGATHCDLYDGGNGNYIPWDKLQTFFETYLK